MKQASKQFLNVSSIVLDSYKIIKTFKEEYVNFRKEKKCNFNKIDKLEKELFVLKEYTHALFRAEGEKEIEETDLYDSIISSIFHEMLHLKEYIYILEKYEPRYLLLEKKLENDKIDEFKKDFLKHSREIVGEAKLGLPLKMQGINEFINDALHHLEQVIKIYAFNSHLIRTLYVSADILNGIYPDKGLEHLYDIIYDGGRIEGYFLVAESFIKSGFTPEAKGILEKVLSSYSKLSLKENNYKLKQDYIERARTELQNL